MFSTSLWLVFGLAVGGMSAVAADTGTCDQVFNRAFTPGRHLDLNLRAGDIEVFGTPEAELRVVCRLDNPSAARDVQISYTSEGDGGRLRIEGGPSNGFHVRIYIPQKVTLNLKCSAGNLTLDGVDGDKEVRLRAGNLYIRGARPADYGRLDASVTAGNVSAPAFGGEKSGLFRSLKRTNSAGKYRLRAHVSAGNIEIR